MDHCPTELRLSRRLVAGLLVSFCLAVLHSGEVASAGPPQTIKDFKELTAITKQLESAQSLLDAQNQEYQSRRRELLALFAREPKSAQCDRHYEQVSNVINDYRVKAYEYASDCRKGGGNWLSNIVKLGGPLGSMKGLSKFDAELATLTQRYEAQSKKALFTDSDIDCDLAKFQIRQLDSILYVLQTDVKYLAVEDPQVFNANIFSQLKQDKFVSQNNFYDIDQLKPRQRELLKEFYASRVDLAKRTLEEALEHFQDPGSLIIGRLLDSCHSVVSYEQIWRNADSKRQADCSKSTSDPSNESAAAKYKLDKYEDVIEFCHQFLDAL